MAAAELNAYPDPHLCPDWQRLLIHICLSAIFLLLSWLMLTEMVLSLVGTLAFKGSGWPDMTLQKQTKAVCLPLVLPGVKMADIYTI